MSTQSGRLSVMVVVGTFLGVLLVGVTGSRVSVAAASERATMGMFVDEGCEYECRTCGDNKHDIVVAVVNHHSSSHLENCNTGSCSSHECGNSLRVQEVWDSALEAEGTALVQLLDANRDIAEYNHQRRSLQLRCDKGKLVASPPLTDSQALALLSFE